MTISKDGIPWPDTWQFREPSKRPDIREIEWATAREYAEQDVWRERLESLQELNLPNRAFEYTKELGLTTLFSQMKEEDAIYPPSDQERKRWYERGGQEWDWSMSPNHLLTSKIPDEKLRHAVHWLLEIGQHKERIKSQVLLPGILKVNPRHPDTGTIFSIWKAVMVAEELQIELPLPDSAFGLDDWSDEDRSAVYGVLKEIF